MIHYYIYRKNKLIKQEQWRSSPVTFNQKKNEIYYERHLPYCYQESQAKGVFISIKDLYKHLKVELSTSNKKGGSYIYKVDGKAYTQFNITMITDIKPYDEAKLVAHNPETNIFTTLDKKDISSSKDNIYLQFHNAESKYYDLYPWPMRITAIFSNDDGSEYKKTYSLYEKRRTIAK